MKKIQVLLLFTFFVILSQAQTVLLNVDRTKESKNERGPNLKKFTHIYISVGCVLPVDEEGAKIKFGSSIHSGIGVRKKYRVSAVYSPGWDLELNFTNHNLKQYHDRIFPDSIVNDESGFGLTTFSISFMNRFNFDPNRGNFLGTYMDLGITGDFHMSMRYSTSNELPDGTVFETTHRKLNYTNNIGSRAFLRFGYSHISLYASYRITDLFKPSYNYPELPRIIMGLQLAVF